MGHVRLGRGVISLPPWFTPRFQLTQPNPHPTQPSPNPTLTQLTQPSPNTPTRSSPLFVPLVYRPAVSIPLQLSCSQAIRAHALREMGGLEEGWSNKGDCGITGDWVSSACQRVLAEKRAAVCGRACGGVLVCAQGEVLYLGRLCGKQGQAGRG